PRSPSCSSIINFLSFNAPPPPTLSPLSLHDALPISCNAVIPAMFTEAACSKLTLAGLSATARVARGQTYCANAPPRPPKTSSPGDRKSTRLNSSHVSISYAVFCLKKKKKKHKQQKVT